MSYAKRFHSPEVSFLDLINEGNIGLIQAARRFDPDRGVKFITYAVWWVRQAISHALSEQWGAIRLPHKQATLHSRVARVKRGALAARSGASRRWRRSRDEAGLTLADAESLMAHDTQLGVAFRRSSASRRTGPSRTRSSRRPSPRPTSSSCAARPSSRRGTLLETLPKKERAILCRRFGIPEDGTDGEREPMTLQEIGEELKLSRERVRQIEAQAIARIKRTLKTRALKAYLN